MMKALIAILALSLIAACASLNESQCEDGDWYGIGLRDGANGRYLDHFDRHVKACSKHGISPEPGPWREGRDEGLRLYCTPQKAYELGRSGRRPNTVCTAAEAADMSLPNRIGMEYYRIGQEISDIKDDIREIDQTLATIGDTDPELTERLLSERAHLRFKVRRLERQQDRYAHWP